VDSEAVMEVLRDPVARRLLESPLLTHLAYNGIDGTPRVVPIGYIWTGSTFVMCTAMVAPKVRSLQRDPRVALTIDTGVDKQPPNMLLVRGVASVEIVEGIPDEFLAASRKGLPEEQWSDFENQVRSFYPAMARISVTPQWAKVLDFETRLPIAVEQLAKAKPPTT
jgi:Pyridoxamine 5'-phosphate oxidase